MLLLRVSLQSLRNSDYSLLPVVTTYAPATATSTAATMTAYSTGPLKDVNKTILNFGGIHKLHDCCEVVCKRKQISRY